MLSKTGILRPATNAPGASDKALTDYQTYSMTVLEKAFYIALAAAFISVISFIFYRNFIISTVLMPLALLFPRFKTRDIIKKRTRELNLQFKDMLYSLSSSLSAGRSVEGAFRDVLRDLAVLYPDPNSFIMREVECIVRRLEMNETIENILSDFAARAHIEDVYSFVDVFRICKRSGGNIVEVIRNTSAIINDRIEVRQEIDTLLAERRFEQKVLNVVPIFLMVVLSASAAEYMEPIFTTAAGRLVTSISIVLLAAAYLISRKITDIRL